MRFPTFVVVISVLSLALHVAFADAPPPRLIIEDQDAGHRISVEISEPGDEPFRILLRETSGPVEPGVTGWDPTLKSAFATWNESGERWTAHSRDGGRSWSEARAVETAIRLRAGAVTDGQAMPRVASALRSHPSGELRIVQFVAPILPEWRRALEQVGARSLAHMPHNAEVVRIPAAALETLRGFSFVERVESYEPGYRIPDDVRAWIDEGDGSVRDLRVMSFVWGDAGKAPIIARALELGVEVLANWPSGHIVELRLDAGQLTELLHLDDVMWADFWTPAEMDMDLVREDAGSNFIENTLGYCGDGVRGEVMDSGIQEDHPDFDGIILHGGHDTSSHGTSTYGIVFGNGDRDGDGEAKALGHMPCAQGIFADYGNVGDRFAHTEELKDSPYFASFQTNSWGNSRTTSYTSISHEMDDIIWRLDIAILQSQSNAGNQNSRPQAWAKNIISVGGIRHKDTLTESDDEWSGGASIGPAEDGRIKPDLNYWYDSIYTTTTGSGYTSSFGGTSAATPESAGVIGLLVQLWSENIWGTEPEGSTVFERQPHASTIKALAINNAKQYTFTGTDSDLTRVHQGWGRPNAQIAYERAERSFIVDEEQPLAFGESVSYDVDVFEGESELKVTMIYPDPPGTTSSTLHRINDLNLKVVSPAGTTYWGNNGLDAGNYSTPGGAPNGVDTVENVFVSSPAAGTWTVEIEAVEINQDAHLDTPESDAVFALVVTGGGGFSCDGPDADFTITPNPASVGEEVSFDSTVSGGAGGPFEYAWDFDGDDTIDSSEADPIHVYTFAYEGPVTLTVSDAEDCPTEVENPITVTGPDIRYDSYSNLTEIEGNGNGAIDPGETWEISVSLRNDGNEAGAGVEANLEVHPLTAGPLVLLDDAAAYGDISPAAVATGAPPYRFRVGSQFPCGENIHFSVVNIRSVDPAVTYPDASDAIVLLVGGSGSVEEVWYDGFESDLGWSSAGAGEWQRDAPEGRGAGASLPGLRSYPDPEQALVGSNVIGNDLTGLGESPGNYENNVASTYTSPAIDLADWVLVKLDFDRWLNVLPFDRATFEVTGGGGEWTTLIESDDDGIVDSSWQHEFFDLSSIADRSAAFRMRFTIVSDDAASASGWNVDEVKITATPKESCEPFGVPAPGASAGLELTKLEGGELRLDWQADCGSGASYGIYRGDLALGITSLAQEPGMCDVADTTATLPSGPGNKDFFLVAPNDSAFEGSLGTDSSGVRRDPAADACYPRDAIDACAM